MAYPWELLVNELEFYLLSTQASELCSHFMSQIGPHCLPLYSCFCIFQELPSFQCNSSLWKINYSIMLPKFKFISLKVKVFLNRNRFKIVKMKNPDCIAMRNDSLQRLSHIFQHWHPDINIHISPKPGTKFVITYCFLQLLPTLHIWIAKARCHYLIGYCRTFWIRPKAHDKKIIN